ncbi:hypothetical protein H4R33_002849 [Dimargaris cristalligena]|nr:hypothetical protein H4R33_002849 [Dimargaris cristalligena]
MRSPILFLSASLVHLSLSVSAKPVFDPSEKLPKELRTWVLEILPLPDQVAAANVNHAWRAKILEKPKRLNMIAESEFLANPLSYYSSDISDSEADKKFMDFSPLIGNLVRSIVVQSIHLALFSLHLDKLGNPITRGLLWNHPGAELPIFKEAIQTFKPELEWLNKSAHTLKVNEGSAEVFDTFFPILGKIRTGDSANFAPMIKYVFSDTFTEAMYRQLEHWVPSSYVNFLAILTFVLNTRFIARSEVDHMPEIVALKVPELIKRSLKNTLNQAIGPLVVQTSDFQRIIDIGQVIKKRRSLVEALSDPEFEGMPQDILGYCAVKAGIIKRTLCLKNWLTPSMERLIDQLKVSEGDFPQRCVSLFLENGLSVFLDTDGDASVI